MAILESFLSQQHLFHHFSNIGLVKAIHWEIGDKSLSSLNHRIESKPDFTFPGQAAVSQVYCIERVYAEGNMINNGRFRGLP